jgi:hypothetical protein
MHYLFTEDDPVTSYSSEARVQHGKACNRILTLKKLLLGCEHCTRTVLGIISP